MFDDSWAMENVPGGVHTNIAVTDPGRDVESWFGGGTRRIERQNDRLDTSANIVHVIWIRRFRLKHAPRLPKVRRLLRTVSYDRHLPKHPHSLGRTHCHRRRCFPFA
eukprot:scaffold34620_cov160-Amphora_coffeaeformis.AAC.9